MTDRKIVDYRIVLLSRIDYDPQEEIDDLIKKGYQPNGAPYSFETQYYSKTCQAMVKYEDYENAG